MKRTYYVPEWFLWFVRLGRNPGESEHRQPTVNVVARTAAEAAAEAMEIMRQDWQDAARWLRVQEVRILHGINGMAVAPEVVKEPTP